MNTNYPDVPLPRGGRDFSKRPLDHDDLAARNWQEVEFDHLPKQVATDLLCNLQKTTNGTRKTHFTARTRRFTSLAQPVPREVKMARRCANASWVQLHNWIRRCEKKRAKVQKAYVKLLEMPAENPVVAATKARLDALVGGLDLFLDLCEQAVEQRVPVL